MSHLHSAFADHLAVQVDAVPAIEVGAGCTRRDLPSNAGVRVWVVDMAPGSEWPHVDHHDAGEEFYVLSGEVIEGDTRYTRLAPTSRSHPTAAIVRVATSA